MAMEHGTNEKQIHVPRAVFHNLLCDNAASFDIKH